MRALNWLIGLACLGVVFFVGMSLNNTAIFSTYKKLQIAVNNGDANMAYQLVRKGAMAAVSSEPNTTADTTRLIVTPIRRDQPDVLRALLSGDEPLPEAIADQALAAALLATKTDALSLLLSHKIKPSSQVLNNWISEQQPDDQHPHILVLREQYQDFSTLLASSLEGALDSHNLSLANQLMAVSPATLADLSNRLCCQNSEDAVGITLSKPTPVETGPMQRAATIAGSGPTMKWLTEQQLSVDHADASGKTALMWATIYRQYGNISALLKLGAEVNARDNRGRTALIYAQLPQEDFQWGSRWFARRFRPGIHYGVQVKMLLAGANPYLRDKRGMSALSYGHTLTREGETIPIARALSIVESTK